MKSIVKKSNKEAAFTLLERKHYPLGGVKNAMQVPLENFSNVASPGFLTGFTIVELLTVMSIIIILFGLLVPALNMARRHAKRVNQNAQFHSIHAALELFSSEFEGYPPSEWQDEVPQPYCGAMKLAEAMVGQDLLGFHPDSRFRQDGTIDGTVATDLYPEPFNPETDPDHARNLRARKGPYLPVEGANAYTLESLYGTGNTGPFDPCSVVLCDEYPRVRSLTTGKRVGMPILYYRADTSKTAHDRRDAEETTQNIYNCYDNLPLIDLGLPWDLASALAHPMASTGTTPDGEPADKAIFYDKTRNEVIPTMARPYGPESYILISAGFDGLYGTDDDILGYQD